VLNLILELVHGLARTEDSMNSSKDESEDEGVDLGPHHFSEVESDDGEKSSTSIAAESNVAVKLHLLGNNDSSNEIGNCKDVHKEELGDLTSEKRGNKDSNDQNGGIVNKVRRQVDAETIKSFCSILWQTILGVKVILLHLIHIHD